jgi:LacI family transcriptional regulator
MPNIKDVAREAGVSPMTVSYVINNHPAVKSSTREHVLDVIKRVGYQPSAAARGLQRRRMGAVGVLYGFSGPSLVLDYYLGHVLDGILNANEANEQKTVLFRERDWHSAAAKVSLFTDGYCDGLIIVLPDIDSPIIDAVRTRNVPFVIVGVEPDDPEIPSVDIDNVQCAYDITQAMISLGHSKIGYIAGPPHSRSALLRTEGFRAAMGDSGLSIREDWIARSEFVLPNSLFAPKEFLRRLSGDFPTAIVCADDNIAMGAIAACKEFGISVPADLSITGIDDTIDAQRSAPALTTMRQPVIDIGYQSAMLLNDLILSRRSELAQSKHLQIRLPTELVMRESTAPPRSGP